MKYIRFARPNQIAGNRAREGFFCAAYELREDQYIDEHTSARLEILLSWFRQNLTIPNKFSRSKPKGCTNNIARGISWFKEDASEAIEHSFDLVNLLSENGFPIDVLRSERVGYIVYEDLLQVVAEPFSDTLV